MKRFITKNEKAEIFLANRIIRKGKTVMMKFMGPLFFSLLFAIMVPSQTYITGEQTQTRKPEAHFYNVDRETTIEGQVEDLRFEARYEGKSHFLILMVRDKNSGELIEVETAPAWFFQTDIHKGEKVRLVGSISEEGSGKKVILAREIRINNRTITLRDRRGFPTWSGGRGRRR